jgi:outer membrane protein, heavy metal efflux system
LYFIQRLFESLNLRLTSICCVSGINLTLALVVALVIARPFTIADAAELTPYTLERAISQVELTNRQVLNAKRQIEGAQADIQRADVGINPTVSIAAFNSFAGQYRPSQLDQTVRIEQTFERGGKRALRVASARQLETAAFADLNETIRQQKIICAAAYAEVAVSQRLKQLSDENLVNYQRLLDGAQRRLKAGDIASADVSRLSVEVARAVNDVRGIENNQAQARFRLANVMGQENILPQAIDRLPDASAFNTIESLLKPESHAKAVQASVENRSDVVAANARVRAQEKALELAKSLQTRDVTLGAQTETSPSLGGRVFGLSASVPLFVNNSYAGDIARASADIAIAENEVQRLKAQVRFELDSAYAQLLAARDRLQVFTNSAVPEVTKVSQAIEYAYTRGAATLTDLFDARRQFNAVLVEAANAQSEFAKALYVYKASIDAQL